MIFSAFSSTFTPAPPQPLPPTITEGRAIRGLPAPGAPRGRTVSGHIAAAAGLSEDWAAAGNAAGMIRRREESEDDRQEGRPAKRARSLPERVMATAYNTAVIAGTVGVELYKLWRDRNNPTASPASTVSAGAAAGGGDDSFRTAEGGASDDDEQREPPPPYTSPLQLPSALPPHTHIASPSKTPASPARRRHIVVSSRRRRPLAPPTPASGSGRRAGGGGGGRGKRRERGDDERRLDHMSSTLEQLIAEGQRALQETVDVSDLDVSDEDDEYSDYNSSSFSQPPVPTQPSFASSNFSFDFSTPYRPSPADPFPTSSSVNATLFSGRGGTPPYPRY